MKKVGVIANPKRPHAADIFERLARKAESLHWKLFADAASAEQLPSATVIELDEFSSTVDVLLAMGGDEPFCSAPNCSMEPEFQSLESISVASAS
jgi:hypothetical protein